MSDAHEEQVSSYIPCDIPTAPPAEESNGFEQIEQNEIENAVDTAINTVTRQVEEAASDIFVRGPEHLPPAAVSHVAKSAEPAKKICTACPYNLLGNVWCKH